MKKHWKESLASYARWIIKGLLQKWLRIEVKGTYVPHPKSVIIANRTSVIDVLLLSMFLPERLTVALPPELIHKVWVKALILFAEVIPVNPSSPKAVRVLLRAIEQGKRCLIFPQGLQDFGPGTLKIYDGPGLILQKAGAVIIPVRIQGAEYSIFSVNKEKHGIKLFPKILLHVMPPLSLQAQENETLSRQKIARKLFSLISDMSFANCNTQQALFLALIEGMKIGSKNKARLEDANRNPLSYRQLLARIFILGRQMKRHSSSGETVGVMLPTTLAGMVTFFALQAYRRVPAMLNFSSGFTNVLSACNTANISTIFTARQFIHTAKLESLIEQLINTGIQVFYLEDFKKNIGILEKLSGVVKGALPRLSWWCIGRAVEPTESAVILFTSGSEGQPKGVVLSHTNVLANCYQLVSRVDFSSRDRFFNALPIFHSFGLTAGCILPMVTGNNIFFYPSPLHYKIIPGLVYEAGGTILFATDTFLAGYAKAASSHEFSSVRYIFAGAERVKPETIAHWARVFGAKIYEGYGATEAAPVISLNCPLETRLNSVGLPLPSIQCRIEAVDGINEGGRLYIKGPNVMRGYMHANNPGNIESLSGGWHDTGDIVHRDEDGFIFIKGRAKRFAKIGGEMVSLTAVEAVAATLWPEYLHAAIAVNSDNKGEQILLFSEAPLASKQDFIYRLRASGGAELLVPKIVYEDVKIPVLASGKIDYISLKEDHETLKNAEIA